MSVGSWKDIDKAASLLKAGEIVTFPTETVYGIGCVYNDEAAFKKLVNLKKRPPNKPFSMMADCLNTALPFLDISPRVEAMLKHFLPGELTFLLKAKKDLPDFVTLGTNVLGLRVPDSQEVQTLLSKVGSPCLVTSANISGKPTSKTFEELDPVFLENTFVIRGPCVSLLPSTIIDLSKEKPLLIRQGKVTFDDILSYWNALSD